MTLVLSDKEVLAVGSLLGHALDIAHEDVERDYLQRSIDGEYDAATETREAELETILRGVLDRLTVEPKRDVVTISVSREAAIVAHDNLYERLREEDENDWENDSVARALLEVTNALAAAGASSR
jgi:nitric oxide reductase large subunit